MASNPVLIPLFVYITTLWKATGPLIITRDKGELKKSHAAIRREEISVKGEVITVQNWEENLIMAAASSLTLSFYCVDTFF